MTSEVPPELYEPDAPPGTPVAEQATTGDTELAPVYCRHGVRWNPGKPGPDMYWRAEDAEDSEHPGHYVPAVEAGAIPRQCHPLTVWDPAEHPRAVAHRELVERRLLAEGIDPETEPL
jgi:hypothetical protein